MSRPRKWRQVCGLPEIDVFGPRGPKANLRQIVMTVEEYESIRLIDYEGLTQEECADLMKVARTTVQRIYFDARKKLSEVLVEGAVLRIEGGDYKLREDTEHHHCGRSCHRRGHQNVNPDDHV